jgi:hypothetical protein
VGCRKPTDRAIRAELQSQQEAAGALALQATAGCFGPLLCPIQGALALLIGGALHRVVLGCVHLSPALDLTASCSAALQRKGMPNPALSTASLSIIICNSVSAGRRFFPFLIRTFDLISSFCPSSFSSCRVLHRFSRFFLGVLAIKMLQKGARARESLVFLKSFVFCSNPLLIHPPRARFVSPC